MHTPELQLPLSDIQRTALAQAIAEKDAHDLWELHDLAATVNEALSRVPTSVQTETTAETIDDILLLVELCLFIDIQKTLLNHIQKKALQQLRQHYRADTRVSVASLRAAVQLAKDHLSNPTKGPLTVYKLQHPLADALFMLSLRQMGTQNQIALTESGDYYISPELI